MATGTALIQSQGATSVTVTQVQVSKLGDLTSVELDALIKDRAIRCQRHIAGFSRRASELYLALAEMESRFTKQQGARTDLKELPAQTWTEYVESSGVNPATYRKWKSRMDAAAKQLGTVIDPTPIRIASGSATKKVRVSATAKKNLADAKAQLGASAEGGNAQAAAIIAEYEQAATAIDSSPLTNEDNATSERGVVIKPTKADFASGPLAEEGSFPDAPPAPEDEKVAAAPEQLDPSAGDLNAEPDWKQVVVDLISVLEQSGSRLPLTVLAEKRRIESLLAGKESGQPQYAAPSQSTKRYNKVMRPDVEGNRRWTVVAEGEMNAWGSFEIESDADDAIAYLRSPVVSLMVTDSASKMLPATETPISGGRVGSHESAG